MLLNSQHSTFKFLIFVDGMALECNLVGINVHSVFPVILLFSSLSCCKLCQSQSCCNRQTQLFLMIQAAQMSIRVLFISNFCQFINIYHLDEPDISVGIEFPYKFISVPCQASKG